MTSTIAKAKRALFELRTEWQARSETGLDLEHVEQLAGVLDDDRDLPPISVVKLESGALAIVDGYHRFAAYVQAQRPTVPYVIVGKGEACIPWHLARANAENGRSRSSKDKRLAIRRAIEAPEGADMSNTDIARWCAVSDELVRVVRAELRGAPSAAAERQQILRGEREATPDSPTVPRSTAHDSKTEAKKPTNDVRIAETGNPDTSSSEPEAPAWTMLAEACRRIAAAVVAIKRERSADLKIVPGSQEVVDLLTRAHGIVTRRAPQACPAPHQESADCPICDGKGYVLGDPGNWQAQLAAHARAHG